MGTSRPPAVMTPLYVMKDGHRFACRPIVGGWKCGACFNRTVHPGERACRACGAAIVGVKTCKEV